MKWNETKIQNYTSQSSPSNTHTCILCTADGCWCDIFSSECFDYCTMSGVTANSLAMVLKKLLLLWNHHWKMWLPIDGMIMPGTVWIILIETGHKHCMMIIICKFISLLIFLKIFLIYLYCCVINTNQPTNQPTKLNQAKWNQTKPNQTQPTQPTNQPTNQSTYVPTYLLTYLLTTRSRVLPGKLTSSQQEIPHILWNLNLRSFSVL